MAKKIIKAITWAAGLLLVLSIAGVDSDSNAPWVVLTGSFIWLSIVLFINYRELVERYGG